MTSAVGNAADLVLATFIQGSLKTALSGSAAVGLFLTKDAYTDPQASMKAKDLVSFLRGTRGSLLSLSTAAERLDLASPTSAFFTGTSSVSSSSVLMGEVIPGSSSAYAPTKASYTFTISQLAVAQANLGTALTASAVNAFTAGTNTVRVTQAGVDTDLSFTVTGGQSNSTVLNSFAAAINANSSVGVTASVLEDAVAGSARLLIVAKNTGTAKAFSLSSIAGTPVADAGVGAATTTVANLSYTQNGTALTNSSNELYLDSKGKTKVTFLGTSASAVTLTVGADTTQISSAVSSFVNAFNDAKGFFDNHVDEFPEIVTQLRSVVSRAQGLLANVGINVDPAGEVSIDAAKPSNSINQYLSSVERALGDVGGLAKEARAIADRHLSTPRTQLYPLPPFHPGNAIQTAVGTFAGRLNDLQLSGLLVSTLA